MFEVIDDTARKIDDAVNRYFGSMFRTGSATSFFAMQTARYADLYAPTFLNLIKYVDIVRRPTEARGLYLRTRKLGKRTACPATSQLISVVVMKWSGSRPARL